MTVKRGRFSHGRNDQYVRISVERLPYLQALIQSYRVELDSWRMEYRDRPTRERRAEVEREVERLTEIQTYLILARRTA